MTAAAAVTVGMLMGSAVLQICFIAFLPDIRETQAEGRNALIALEQALADKNKRRPFGWVWVAAGSQPTLEKALDVGGFGFPAMVAVNAKKKKFATLRTAFTEESIQDFVNLLVSKSWVFCARVCVEDGGGGGGGGRKRRLG